MPAAIPITPGIVRAYANLPPEVPEALLSSHIGIAERDLTRRTGLSLPAAGQEGDWAEALTVRALASVYPWLNTFALSGAAKVGRLEGAVEFRFLAPDDVSARVDALMARFDDLVALLTPDDDPDAPGSVIAGGVMMTAI